MTFFRRFKFDTQWFLASLVFICGLGAYVNLLEPTSTLSVIGLLCVITCITFSSCMFLIRSVRRAMLYATGVTIYLTLRFLGLREWYFPFLLMITVLSTDAYLVRLDKERIV